MTEENYWSRKCATGECNNLPKPLSDYCGKCKKDEVYLNNDAGYYAVIKILQNAGVEILESFEMNKDRYRIAKTKNSAYLIMYKKDFFNSFGKIFESKGESGVGETVNVEDLKGALRKGVTDLVFVYRTGKIYMISVADFMEFSHRRVTDAEGKAVRSVSVRHLKDFSESINYASHFHGRSSK